MSDIWPWKKQSAFLNLGLCLESSLKISKSYWAFGSLIASGMIEVTGEAALGRVTSRLHHMKWGISAEVLSLASVYLAAELVSMASGSKDWEELWLNFVDGVHQLQKRGLIGRRLYNFGSTDPEGQTVHFCLVNNTGN